MADNIAVTAGTGTNIAADDIGGGILAQRVKPVWGPDGTGNDTDVASGKALPVQVRSATGLIPIGEPTDAAATATDTTSVTGVSLWKQISKTLQAFITLAGAPFAKITDGTNTAAVKAASTAPAATDPAVVVAISPNSVNANLSDGSAQTSASHVGAPTVPLDAYSQYETVAASTTAVMGATGAQYDYLAGVLIIPGTSAAGIVQIKDGNGSAITVFAGGGTTVLSDLKPFMVPLGLHALAASSPGWSVITNANVTAIGIGKFT